MSEKEVRVDNSELVESIGTVEELRASDHTSIHTSEESKNHESKSTPDHKSSSEIHPVHESGTEKKEHSKEDEKPKLKELEKLDSESSDSSSKLDEGEAKDEIEEEKVEQKEEHKILHHHEEEHDEEVKENLPHTELVNTEAHKEPAADPEIGAVQSLLEKAKVYVNENSKYILGGVTIAALTLGALKFKRRRG